MIDCSFILNNESMSFFQVGATKFSAFSGVGKHRNRRFSACLPNLGPIPPGSYYIFDRQSGGLLGPLRDLFTGRDEWFALYAIDEKIDDETYCDLVKRGKFRLHPKGPLGLSYGCIVIEKQTDYNFLRAILKGSKKVTIPEVGLEAYGKVIVR
jgi:hypothetical protein